MIKVRFAPSPTGLLHAGNVKIALLNYLFCKKNNGNFVLRIDDTDLERSTLESEEMILQDLQWLNIKWDEFYRQSERIDTYTYALEQLKAAGRVYPCYETKEELNIKRKIQASQNKTPVYDRAALKLTISEKTDLENKGIKPYWRFKLSDNKVINWTDLVHGKISIPLNSTSDPIVVKPDGSFVYTFASVVDDINIGITHIIRGDDHVTNTAAQIDLFEAICGTHPNFAHIPLMASIDGEEVSKRTGSSLSIINMRNNGIDPRAILTLLATLGTSLSPDHKDNLESLIEKFDFKHMSLSSPKFSINDINLLNKKILADKTFDEVQPYLSSIGINKVDEIFWNTIKDNIHNLNEAIFWYDIFYKEIQPSSLNKNFLQIMESTLINPIDFDTWISSIKELSQKKGKDLYHPIRLAITGVDHGPELKKIVNILGYDLVKSRIEKSIGIS